METQFFEKEKGRICKTVCTIVNNARFNQVGKSLDVTCPYELPLSKILRRKQFQIFLLGSTSLNLEYFSPIAIKSALKP